MLRTEGFDLPEIDCILVARPTKSPLLLTQIIGRGTRVADGKEDCLIIDTAQWQREEHAITAASLFDLEPSRLDPEKTVRENVEIEEKEQRAKGKQKEKKKQGKIDEKASDYFKFLDTLMNGINDITENFKPTEHWHNHPATEKQTASLTRQLEVIGEKIPEGITKGQASAIGNMLWDTMPATTGQRRLIGYLYSQQGVRKRIPANLTKSEAGNLINQLKGE